MDVCMFLCLWFVRVTFMRNSTNVTVMSQAVSEGHCLIWLMAHLRWQANNARRYLRDHDCLYVLASYQPFIRTNSLSLRILTFSYLRYLALFGNGIVSQCQPTCHIGSFLLCQDSVTYPLNKGKHGCVLREINLRVLFVTKAMTKHWLQQLIRGSQTIMFFPEWSNCHLWL